jgi:hypothetical protein
MIIEPVAFTRDFRNDFAGYPDASPESCATKCEQVAFALLPLAALSRHLRGPISLGMSCLRGVGSFQQALKNLEESHFQESLYHFLHAGLAAASVACFVFSRVCTFIMSSLSDTIIHLREGIEHFIAGNMQEAIESLLLLMTDVLFLASIFYGAVEVTVLCFLLQIALDIYFSIEGFRKGDTLGGVCKAILSFAHLSQLMPQMSALNSQKSKEPLLMDNKA